MVSDFSRAIYVYLENVGIHACLSPRPSAFLMKWCCSSHFNVLRPRLAMVLTSNTFEVPQPVTYGSEIILSDTQSGISTAPLVIRKVDKGKIASDDGGPVSQMQKIALQRINQDGSRHYLSAAGPMPGPAGVTGLQPGQPGTHTLIFQGPRVREEVKDGVRTLTDEVDDYLCWTIVGICESTIFQCCGPT